jgi:hypothetical protein
MEMSSGNSLCSYLYFNKQKYHFLFFLLQNWRTGGWNRSCVCWGEGCKKINAVQIPCTHVCKYKTDTWWNYFMKGEQWRGWIQVWYIWYIVRTFVNTAMYPYPAQQSKTNKNYESLYLWRPFSSHGEKK